MSASNSEGGGMDGERVGIGIVGCGTISGAYLKAARRFPILDVRGVADLDTAAAQARGAEFGHPAVSVEALLADPTVEIVVNLTVPQAHYPVAMQALDAGNHVHNEKPLCVTLEDGRRLVAHAEAKGLRLGCAPDTFLGGAHQTARKLIDQGAIGIPVGGTAFFGMLVLALAAGGDGITGARAPLGPLADATPDIVSIGRSLFTTHVFALEATALLLTIAVVGAVVMVRKAGRIEPDDDLSPEVVEAEKGAD